MSIFDHPWLYLVALFLGAVGITVKAVQFYVWLVTRGAEFPKGTRVCFYQRHVPPGWRVIDASTYADAVVCEKE